MATAAPLIIDADTHLTEPHDLWVKRAPAALRDRVPQVKMLNGQRCWVIDGDKSIGHGAHPNSAVLKEGGKIRDLDTFLKVQFEEVHAGSSSVKERLALMDDAGIFAQIVYPNILGFGGQASAQVDPELRLACVQIYNDAMAELQEESGQRLFPMALLPWWDVNQAVAETERCIAMGLKGININSDPHTSKDEDGNLIPDLGTEHWFPLWEVCEDKKLPVNFHIGASETSFNMFGRAAWPSMGWNRRLALGSAALFVENSRVISNLLYSGLFDRCKKLKIVSVESGIGWIPFVLESIDYEWTETDSGSEQKLSMAPSEYFKKHVYGCFWFEKTAPTKLIDQVGEDNVLFETDFPHPTCLYPKVQEYIAEVSAGWSEPRKRKILQDNASKLYGITLPG